MISRLRHTEFHGCYWKTALLLMILTAQLLHAGNGRFRDGVFNFCVSVRFEATGEQLEKIKAAFGNASRVLEDATDGQHRLGEVTIINNSGASDIAEYWINSGSGRAYATLGDYGVRGQHVMLYFDSNFTEQNGSDGDSYTIAHEHAHHAYGVADEYSGPTGENAECAGIPDNASLSYSLMDNYFTRGGQVGGSDYTLNEFCVRANHDPDSDTWQTKNNNQSSWETIAAHPTRSATAPAGLPTDAPPGARAVTFQEGIGGLRLMLLLDRSGSMRSNRRLSFAKAGAVLFSSLVTEGGSLGVASFSSDSSVNFPLTEVSAGARSAARSAILALEAGGGTNIGLGLETALAQLTAQEGRSCNEIIVLLSDGDGTLPNSVIDNLLDEGVTVFSMGVGDDLSTSGQQRLQNVAQKTGGKFFRVASSFGLVEFFLRAVMDSTGNALLANSPLTIGPSESKEVVVPVERGAGSAVFGVAIEDETDDIALALESPSGRLITEADAVVEPDVELVTEDNSRVFRIDSPESGDWMVRVSSGEVNSGNLQVLAFARHDGVGLNVSVEKDTVVFPEPIRVFATPTFEGQAVIGAQVSGVVVRPGGSQAAIELFDDGLDEHGDAMPGDGRYSALFADFSGEGTYTFELTVENEAGMTFPGEGLFPSPPAPAAIEQSVPVPPFVRRGSATAIVTGAPAGPAINQGGVVDAASFQALLAPGGIASIFGVDLAPSVAQAGGVPLPTELNGVRVTVNGLDAPLFFVAPTQINFQAPFEVPSQGALDVVVIRDGVPSSPVSVPVAEYAPAVFSSAAGEPIVQRHPDGQLITAANPAQPGDVLIIFLTGIGGLSNPPPTGEQAPGSPLATALQTPVVTVGGVSADVVFAGLAPFFVGLGQINVVLPAAMPNGSELPLVVRFGGNASAPANLPIQSNGPGGPDVGVQLAEVLPTTVVEGDRLTLRYRVLNAGGVTGEAARSLYLSADAAISPGEDTLINTRPITLAGGDENFVSRGNLLPNGLVPGTYFLGIAISAPGDTNPSNDISNSLSIDVAAQRPPFDLGISVDSVAPTLVGFGDPISVTYTVSGQNQLSGTFNRSIYISTDSTITTADVLVNTRTFDLLEGTAAVTSENNFVPRTLAPGNYFVGVIVETEGDTNPADNTSGGLPLTVTAQRTPFDLGVRAESVSPSAVPAGGAITVSYAVDNFSLAQGIYIREIYISADSDITTADTLLNRRTFAVNGEGTRFDSTNNVVPADLAPGNYFIGVIIEDGGDTDPSDNASNGLPLAISAGALTQSGAAAALTGRLEAERTSDPMAVVSESGLTGDAAAGK